MQLDYNAKNSTDKPEIDNLDFNWPCGVPGGWRYIGRDHRDWLPIHEAD